MYKHLNYASLCALALLPSLLLTPGCDSDSDPMAEAHPLTGSWEVKMMAGRTYPNSEMPFEGYLIRQEGVLQIYEDGLGYLDLTLTTMWDGDPPRDDLFVHAVRVSDDGEDYRIRLTHYDSVIFLGCQTNGDTLNCTDEDPPPPSPDFPEQDPSVYEFQKM